MKPDGQARTPDTSGSLPADALEQRLALILRLALGGNMPNADDAGAAWFDPADLSTVVSDFFDLEPLRGWRDRIVGTTHVIAKQRIAKAVGRWLAQVSEDPPAGLALRPQEIALVLELAANSADARETRLSALPQLEGPDGATWSPPPETARSWRKNACRKISTYLLDAAPTPRPDTVAAQVLDARRASSSEGQLSLGDVPSLYLDCASGNSHTCDFRHSWCRALMDSSIPATAYVPPRAKVFLSDGRAAPAPLDEVFETWLDRPEPRHLLLLGDYGAGKTSACLHLYERLARDLVSSPKVPLVPVYVALDVFARDGPKVSGLHDLVAIGLGADGTEVLDLHAPTPERLYILDGLDEMGTAATVSAVRSHLALLRPLLDSARVLLSCRTHLFASESELETVLANANLVGDLLAEIRQNPAYTIAEIEDLTLAEILGIVSKVLPSEDPETTWQELGVYYDLQDLARRPILLGLILHSLPVLRRRAQSAVEVTESDLYDAYIQSWTLREMTNKGLQAEPGEKLRLAEAIAASMYRNSITTINRAALSDEIRRAYSKYILSHTDFQLFDYDTRDASFLSCDLAGNYRFLHRSFMEYFVARAFASDLAQPTAARIWATRWLGREVAQFLLQMLGSRTHVADLGLVVDLAGTTEDAIERWNALHILSLSDIATAGAAAVSSIASDLVPFGFEEDSAVLVRQYARVAAKFVSYEVAAALIDRVLAIVMADVSEDLANDDTYINYYGGVDAAASALLRHVSASTRGYDRSIHLHVLGRLGSPVHAEALAGVNTSWPTSDRRAALKAIEQIRVRHL